MLKSKKRRPQISISGIRQQTKRSFRFVPSSDFMACTKILNSWTFPSLVGAFLDLVLAYFMLCCSALAYFTAQFLAVFGLSLPCPCNGTFGHPNPKCLQGFLVDAPTQKISTVHMSIKNRFPFDSMWTNNYNPNSRFLREKSKSPTSAADTPFLEFDGEESCSSQSFSTASRNDRELERELDGPCVEFSASPGKGISSRKPPSGLRRRRRGLANRGKVSSAVSSSSSHQQWIGEKKHESHGVQCHVPADSEEGSIRRAGSVESNGQPDEGKVKERNASFVEELVRDARDEANTIRILEQAVEEEHAARSALLLELEKERSAAATATDEAMGMILRLQEEKALIEMEARQYQRLIEEKSSYDEEEMKILKEILLRREREKHFLEKEVEAYRHILFPSEKNLLLEDDLHGMVDGSGQRPCSSFDSSDDPVLILQEINESIEKKEMQKNINRLSDNGPLDEIRSGPRVLEKEFLSFGSTDDADFMRNGHDKDVVSTKDVEKNLLHVPECMNRCNLEFQEKGNDYSSALQGEGTQLEVDSHVCGSNKPGEHGLHERTYHFATEQHGQEHKTRICQVAAQKADEIHSKPEKGFLEKNYSNDDFERSSDYRTLISEEETGVLDVHVIDDKSNICDEENGKNELPLMNAKKSFDKGGFPLESSGMKLIDVLSNRPVQIRRSCSDMSIGLPPCDSSRSKVLLSGLRHNSISSVDNERLKLETEVSWLRERLTTVQKGREKLSFTMDHRQRENIQLQLLEEIACQLREIRSLTQPGKAIRQASLPPTSSKVSSKKRRCRSVSLGLKEGTQHNG